MHATPIYGPEPTLAELLDDPIVQQLMISDGVSRDDVLLLRNYAVEAARCGVGDVRGRGPVRARLLQ